MPQDYPELTLEQSNALWALDLAESNLRAMREHIYKGDGRAAAKLLFDFTHNDGAGVHLAETLQVVGLPTMTIQEVILSVLDTRTIDGQTLYAYVHSRDPRFTWEQLSAALHDMVINGTLKYMRKGGGHQTQYRAYAPDERRDRLSDKLAYGHPLTKKAP